MTSSMRSRRRRRAVALAVGVATPALVLLGAHSVLAGPLRDSDAARFVFGDPSREDALTQCAEWIAEERKTPAPGELTAVKATFGTDPLSWKVGGFATTGGAAEQFTCTLTWFPRPSVVYRASLALQDGLRFGIEGPDLNASD